MTQATLPTRLVKAHVASKDTRMLTQYMHKGLIKQEDLNQLEEIKKRSLNPDNIPLLDKGISSLMLVLLDCEREIQENMTMDTIDMNRKLIKFMPNKQEVPQSEIKYLKPLPLQHTLNSDDIKKAFFDSPQIAKVNSFENVKLDGNINLVKKIIGFSTANQKERNNFIKHRVAEVFGRHETDYGSFQVQGNIVYLYFSCVIYYPNS